jgi:hypothetical protein
MRRGHDDRFGGGVAVADERQPVDGLGEVVAQGLVVVDDLEEREPLVLDVEWRDAVFLPARGGGAAGRAAGVERRMVAVRR